MSNPKKKKKNQQIEILSKIRTEANEIETIITTKENVGSLKR